MTRRLHPSALLPAGLLAVSVVLLSAVPVHAQTDVVRRTPFDQGSIRIRGGGSYQQFGGQGYFAISAGTGYFLVDGLEAGLDVTSWLGQGPTITQFTPRLTYTVHQIPRVHPYAGVLARYWVVSQGGDNFGSAGARAGLTFQLGERAWGTAGVVYERLLRCTRDCETIFPEFGVSFAF
jgi:hypothetical protein